ncbi:MAG TPA: OsmC family protein [Bryobacteraceae bacterium]|nr:OsmC family protein [Bryobacteraceae bacterium]
MEITVQHVSGVQFGVETRGHRIVSDQPLENSGTDTGMTPPELLLASLGTCAGYYAAQYMMARSLPMAGLEVKVSAEKELKPARLDRFRIVVKAPGVDPKHLPGLERAVKLCLIHNTLVNAPSIETVIETAAAQTV